MTRFAALKADIDHELRNLKRLAKELDDILTATKEGSIARTRAVGSLLHDFYTGVEKIFSQIAIKIDQDLPAGEGWHIQLLKKMTIPIEGTRPRVIEIISRRYGEYYPHYIKYLLDNIFAKDIIHHLA